jgi:hypothetical protein
VKEEALPKYVEETPKGEKKSKTRTSTCGKPVLTRYSPQAPGRRIPQGLHSLGRRVSMVRLVGEGGFPRARIWSRWKRQAPWLLCHLGASTKRHWCSALRPRSCHISPGYSDPLEQNERLHHTILAGMRSRRYLDSKRCRKDALAQAAEDQTRK